MSAYRLPVLLVLLAASNPATAWSASFSLAGDPNLGGPNPLAVLTSPVDGSPAAPFFSDVQMYFPGDDLDALTATQLPPLNKIVTPLHPFGTYTVLYSLKDGHSGTIESLPGEEIWKVSALDADRRTLLDETRLGVPAGSDVDGFDHRDPPGLVFTEYSVGNGSPPPGPMPPPGPDTNALFTRDNVAMMLNQTVDYATDIATVAGPFVDNIRSWTRVSGHNHALTSAFIDTGALFTVDPLATAKDANGVRLQPDTIYHTLLNQNAKPTIYLGPADLHIAVGDEVDAVDIVGLNALAWLTVPEPSSLVLLVTGLLGAGLFLCRRKQRT